MLLGLTLAETEKSIDLHKVSRGSGFAIQIQSLRENRNWGEIQILPTMRMSRSYIGNFVWAHLLSNVRYHIWTIFEVKYIPLRNTNTLKHLDLSCSSKYFSRQQQQQQQQNLNSRVFSNLDISQTCICQVGSMSPL